MSLFPIESLDRLLQEYGYRVVFLGILLESTGLPLPGESLMVAAAIYAATTHHLDIFLLVPIAALGAVLGDQIGYLIGRSVGFSLLARLWRRLGQSNERLEFGRFLFRRYGARIVFLGRFVAFLRTFAALLAGASRMPWHRFLLWNGLGGVCWTCLYGFGAYLLGHEAERLSGPLGIALAVVGTVLLAAAILFVRRNQARLLEEARQEMRRSTDAERDKR
jgi:membrane protein DedA with SNARE-associated domain